MRAFSCYKDRNHICIVKLISDQQRRPPHSRTGVLQDDFAPAHTYSITPTIIQQHKIEQLLSICAGRQAMVMKIYQPPRPLDVTLIPFISNLRSHPSADQLTPWGMEAC